MIRKPKILVPMLVLLVILLLAAACAPRIALQWVTPTPAPPPASAPATPDVAAAVQPAVAATLTAVAQEPTAQAPTTTPGPTESATASVAPTPQPTGTPAETLAATSTAAPTARPPINTPLPPSAWPTPVKELVNQAGRWQVFTSANQVNDLAVQGGILWAATEGGLVRWDIEKRTYAKYTTLNGLPSTSVNTVDVGSDGALWLGTSDGLIRWDGSQWTSFQEQVRGNVNDIAVGRDGALWVASESTGLTRCDGSRWTDIGQKDGLDGRTPVALAVEPSGSVWVGHWTELDDSGALSRWDGQTWITITVPMTQKIIDVTVDANSAVWVGSDGGGVGRWDGKAWTTYTQADGLADDRAQVVTTVPDGSLWVGTPSGSSRWDGEKWVTVKQQDGLAGDNVAAIELGSDGSLWFGSRATLWSSGRGISRWDGKTKTWTTYQEMGNGLLSNTVRAIAMGDDGSSWVGTELGGLNRWDGVAWRDFYPLGTGIDGVTAIALAPDRSIWMNLDVGFPRPMGVMRAEIAQLNIAANALARGPGATTLDQRDGLASNSVHAIAVTGDGAQWFSTSSGLSRYDGKHWTTYTQKDGLADDSVTALAAGPRGVLWVGTDKGLSHWDGKSWTNYTKLDGLPGTKVTALAVAPNGTVWCGTEEDGLGSFDGKTWTTYSQKDGLGDDHIASIAVAPNGDVWVGHSWSWFAGVVLSGGELGVSRWNGKRWTTYAKKDGLADNAVGTIAVGADGVVWIGTDEGLVRFVPAE
jgi:ligand-binding sensor domain-containing protein